MYIFIVFVFFFKQKTAYEMRISDWSSDVCSSDLAFDRIGKALVGLRIALRQPVLLGDVHGDADHMGAAIGIAHHLRARPHPDIMAEIGRASCRERECQYV